MCHPGGFRLTTRHAHRHVAQLQFDRHPMPSMCQERKCRPLERMRLWPSEKTSSWKKTEPWGGEDFGSRDPHTGSKTPRRKTSRNKCQRDGEGRILLERSVVMGKKELWKWSDNTPGLRTSNAYSLHAD